MMPRMSKPRTGWVRGCVCLSTIVVRAACGGASKQADSPGTCPEGTVLRGSDCVPPEGDTDKAADQDKIVDSTPKPAPAPAASADADQAAPSPPPVAPSSSTKTPYDKDAVEV